MQALHRADERTQRMHYHLVSRNAASCRHKVASAGMVLHARDTYQDAYRDVANRVYGFRTNLGVQIVHEGSPAEIAGIVKNDSIVTIAGERVSAEPETLVATAYALIARAGLRGAVTIEVDRPAGPRTIEVRTTAICPSNFELAGEGTTRAETDGRTIQLSAAIVNRISEDDQLAAVIAHELSHVILSHPQRLTQARVHRGMLSGVGRSRRLFRRTEIEADRLSVHLLAKAGYDPAAAARFWNGPGRGMGGGLLSLGTHMAPKARAELVAAEAATIGTAAAARALSTLLASQDAPLT